MFDWLRKERMFEDVCDVNTPISTVEAKGGTLPASGHALSGDCYEMLGVRPAIGRLFTREDDRPAGPHVVVLSYIFGQRQLW